MLPFPVTCRCRFFNVNLSRIVFVDKLLSGHLIEEVPGKTIDNVKKTSLLLLAPKFVITPLECRIRLLLKEDIPSLSLVECCKFDNKMTTLLLHPCGAGIAAFWVKCYKHPPFTSEELLQFQTNFHKFYIKFEDNSEKLCRKIFILKNFK